MSRFSGLSNHARERRRWICASVGVTGIRRFYRDGGSRAGLAAAARRRLRLLAGRAGIRDRLDGLFRLLRGACLARGDVLQLDGVGLEPGDAAALVDDRLGLL